MRIPVQKTHALADSVVNVFIVSDVAGKFHIDAQMLLDNFANLLAQNGVVLFAQLIENKFETERIEILSDQRVFFRKFFLDDRNDIFRLVE